MRLNRQQKTETMARRGRNTIRTYQALGRSTANPLRAPHLLDARLTCWPLDNSSIFARHILRRLLSTEIVLLTPPSIAEEQSISQVDVVEHRVSASGLTRTRSFGCDIGSLVSRCCQIQRVWAAAAVMVAKSRLASTAPATAKPQLPVGAPLHCPTRHLRWRLDLSPTLWFSVWPRNTSTKKHPLN